MVEENSLNNKLFTASEQCWSFNLKEIDLQYKEQNCRVISTPSDKSLKSCDLNNSIHLQNLTYAF